MIAHIDLDAFFASIEIRDNPDLAGQPVIIGHPGKRGVVSTASYTARGFGVHSAMPSVVAQRLCPQGIWIKPRIGYYAAVSHQIRDIFARFSPDVMPVSIDEAFIDLAGTESLLGPPAQVARDMQQAIFTETGLTASVGVAPVMFIAKIASDLKKPNGLVIVEADGVTSFLEPLPIARLWGVGPAMQSALERYGIRTVGQLARYPRDWLKREFGVAGEHLHDLSRGIDRRRVEAGETKSISSETTFPEDVRNRSALRVILNELAEGVAWRLRREGLKGRTVTLKVRFADFRTVTRSHTLSRPTQITSDIRRVAGLLVEQLDPVAPVRLLGVGVSGLGEGPEQTDLFTEADRDKQRRLDEVLDRIHDRFGPDALHRGGKTDRLSED